MKRRALAELEPHFVRESGGNRGSTHVDTFDTAQGISFLCPKCFDLNDGPTGTHSILIWFEGRGVADDTRPLARWAVSGSGLADLTLSPSINLDAPGRATNGCDWHGWITGGIAR
jgi:hypothetical protein